MAEINTKHWYKKWWGILLIIFLLFIISSLSAFGFYVYTLVKKMKNPANFEFKAKTFTSEELKKIEGDFGYWIGTSTPKITIVEFSDFACPYCRSSFPKIREISLKYKNDIKYIYRDMPLHDESASLALAARCAGEQGKFWSMHDKLFQNQGIKNEQDLFALAAQTGVDRNRLEQCYKDKKYLPMIQKDFLDGEELGVEGTPTWFINGNKASGDLPAEAWEEIIGKLLK